MNTILLDKLNGISTSRPPIWLMRQAGRVLPEYRKVRASAKDFKSFVKNPDLASEVTVQPVDILGVDAAIVFSDILVIPEAMGLDYEMIEAKGPSFPKVIESIGDIQSLVCERDIIQERLDYVYQAITQSKTKLNDRVPLIGFAGAPWTIMAYMIEGQGSKTFSKAKKWLYEDSKAAHLLLQKITDATIHYLEGQIAAGAQIIQLFDSWAGVLDARMYREFCIPYLEQIEKTLSVPSIIFAKDAWFALEDLATTSFDAVGLDWGISAEYAHSKLGSSKITQGNADPCFLYADEKYIQDRTREMLREFGTNHIANLGHGLYPDTPLDGVKAYIAAVKAYQYEV